MRALSFSPPVQLFYPTMVRMYGEGLSIDRLVTHEFPADRTADAYRVFTSKQFGKVLITWTDL
jgi:hypothetical protein